MGISKKLAGIIFLPELGHVTYVIGGGTLRIKFATMGSWSAFIAVDRNEFSIMYREQIGSECGSSIGVACRCGQNCGEDKFKCSEPDEIVAHVRERWADFIEAESAKENID